MRPSILVFVLVIFAVSPLREAAPANFADAPKPEDAVTMEIAQKRAADATVAVKKASAYLPVDTAVTKKQAVAAEKKMAPEAESPTQIEIVKPAEANPVEAKAAKATAAVAETNNDIAAVKAELAETVEDTKTKDSEAKADDQAFPLEASAMMTTKKVETSKTQVPKEDARVGNKRTRILEEEETTTETVEEAPIGLAKLGWKEGDILPQTWDPQFIFLSIFIAICGSYTGLTCLMFIRHVREAHWYIVMVIQSGLAIGVCCIWAMHFVGMQALELGGTDKRVVMRFEPWMTIVSGLAAWLIASLAIHCLFHGRTVEQRSNTTMNRSNKLRVAFATFLVSTGVMIMHYMGMMSQTGFFKVDYNLAIVGVSWIISITVSGVGLSIIMFLPETNQLRMIASVVIGLAVNAVHYSGMFAATYTVTPIEKMFLSDNAASMETDAMVIAFIAVTLDLTLLGVCQFYLELVKKILKKEAEQTETELKHKNYMKEAPKLIRKARDMQFPMSLMKFETFSKLGKLRKHEDVRDMGKLLYVDSARAAKKLRRKGNIIIFFSHEWLGGDQPDPKGSQYADMMRSLEELSRRSKLNNPDKHIFVWVDYSSIPQDSPTQQQLAIDSLPMYTSLCSAFVIIAPQVMHVAYKVPCNFTTYSKRLWCRLETLCSIMAAVQHETDTRRNKKGKGGGDLTQASLQPLAEGQDEGEAAEWDSGFVDDVDKAVAPVFLMIEQNLSTLSLLDKTGMLRETYKNLIYVYEGDVTCCAKNHKVNGEEIPCDKDKLVALLMALYGVMLVKAQKMGLLKTGSGVGDKDTSGDMIQLIGEIVKQQDRIFPEDYFGSRPRAMMEYVKLSKERADEKKERLGKKDSAVHPEDGDSDEAEVSDGADLDSDSESVTSDGSSMNVTSASETSSLNGDKDGAEKLASLEEFRTGKGTMASSDNKTRHLGGRESPMTKSAVEKHDRLGAGGRKSPVGANRAKVVPVGMLPEKVEEQAVKGLTNGEASESGSEEGKTH